GVDREAGHASKTGGLIAWRCDCDWTAGVEHKAVCVVEMADAEDGDGAGRRADGLRCKLPTATGLRYRAAYFSADKRQGFSQLPRTNGRRLAGRNYQGIVRL